MTGSGNTSATSVLTLSNSTPAQLYRFRNDGVMFIGSNDTMTIKPFSTNPANVDLAGFNLSFRNNPTNIATSDGTFNFGTAAALTNTTGIANGFGIQIGFGPSGGTAEFNCLAVTPTINQTGGASGITRGILIQPTLTSAFSFRGIETLVSGATNYQMYFGGTAPIFFNGGTNLQFDTATGSKIGSATTQKLAFWNATPIVQPTTAVASATYVAVGGTNIQTNDTFDGYTVAKVIKAIRNIGLIA
jgi:hypothetical protein